ncbi:hypothetical protein IMPR6_690373 [Imperialibacter sp. EC-SDR9]|nr:hypothetical protein IMPERIA89_340374 [Imperialibacter sp. 89]CAD5298018.1 hypothetical protein IMPERIA75_700374 [Imperialibacter sp. 75]VVT34265.1 hypothetical protein IMPR6_690373 [Imperialibacter sp. EC-SDR9]
MPGKEHKKTIEMKKLSMLAAVAIAFGIVVEASAQQIEIGKNTKIERSEVPIRILKSLENEFPETSNFQDQTWYLHYMEGKGSLTAKVYKVVIENSDLDFTAYYKPDGGFEKANEIKKHAQLPEAVEATIHSQYSNWKVVDRNEIISVGRFNRDRFEIQLEKGNLERLILISPDGKVIRDRHS